MFQNKYNATINKKIMTQLYSSKSFNFLQQLYFNNDKEWFVANKKKFDDHILNPTKELISELELFINSIDQSLETKPAINKAITTIYRDTRFSKNKTPLKTHFGINFRKPISTWKQRPSFNFRINPTGYSFGVVIMKNNPDKFHDYRDHINSSPEFRKILKKLSKDKDLSLWGEEYKKYHHQDKNIELWYNKKNLYLTVHKDQNEVTTKENLIFQIMDIYKYLTPFYLQLDKVFNKIEGF